MLKSKAMIEASFHRLYEGLWAKEAAGCSGAEWPKKVPLGTYSKPELEAHFADICVLGDELRSMAQSLGLGVEYATRVVGGTKQSLPTHFVIAGMDSLVAAAGEKKAYAQACGRAQRIHQDFSQLDGEEIAQLLREMKRAVPDEVDFDLACRAGVWFRENDARGLTARQVPLVGFHAKWLDAQGRRSVVAKLAGLEGLPLEDRPAQVRFTYLDPVYLSGGGRRFDSWVEGDICALPYEPEVIVICENRDSALWFPNVERGVAVMGDGFAGVQNVTPIDWIRCANLVVYWGDMDAAGLEILSGYRERGLACESMLMDVPAFETYEEFGTRVDKKGDQIKPKEPLSLPGLRKDERELYLRLIDPKWSGVRRIEQERIPLADALVKLNEIRKKYESGNGEL